MSPSALFRLFILLILGTLSPVAGQEILPAIIADPDPPGRVEGRSHLYADDQGLTVSSTGATLEHPLWDKVWLRLKTVADFIAVDVSGPYDSTGGHVHHHDPTGGNPDDVDAVDLDGFSGASARAGGAGGSKELRAEGMAGLLYRDIWQGRHLELGVDAHASHEPDYQSFGGVGHGQLEFNRRNTTVSGFIGAALDRIAPEQDPHGRDELYPAYQNKVSAGISLGHILTPRLAFSGGVAGAFQAGRMSSPYRSALVHTTLFPERLPGERLRTTAFVQGALYLGAGTALHSLQGVYWDDWGVTAYIPETALAKELGASLLATVRHRYYVQTAADFYEPVYHAVEPILAGDIRLGRLDEQTVGVILEWKTFKSAPSLGPLILSLGYDFAWLEYWDLPGRGLVSHVGHLGATLDY